MSIQGQQPPSTNERKQQGRKKKKTLIRGPDGRFGSASSRKGEAVEGVSSASISPSSSSRQGICPPQLQPPLLQETALRVNENDDDDGHDHDRDDISPGSLLFWHLQLQKEDPRAFISLHMRIFREMHAQGNIDRNKTLRMIKRWHTISLCAEVDVSWGLAAEMARTLEITADEFEGKEVMLLDSPPEQQRRMARQALMQERDQSNALKESQRFRRLNMRGTALWLSSFDGEKYLAVCNERYRQLFPSPQEILEDAIDQKKVPTFLHTCSYAPEAREEYLRVSIEKNLGVYSPSAGTYITKGLRRDREIGLFIVNVQHFVGEDGRPEMYLQLEPAPPSKYLTPDPSTDYQRVMKNYRWPTTFQERLSTCAGGGGGDDGHVASGGAVAGDGGGGGGHGGAQRKMSLVSSMACLPLPALPVALAEATVAVKTEEEDVSIEAFAPAEERGENATTNGDLHEAGTSVPVPFFDANVMDNIFSDDEAAEEQEEGAGEGVR